MLCLSATYLVVYILNLACLFSDLIVSISFCFLPPTSYFLFTFSSLHAAVVLEPLNLKINNPDLICALSHNTLSRSAYSSLSSLLLNKSGTTEGVT
jgi:hypothetical protein